MADPSATPEPENGLPYASPQTPAAIPRTDDRFKVGTLHYSLFGLFMIFTWMIWGNICFTLFENAGGPTILPLYLQDNFHVSNLTVNILTSFIPLIIGVVMTPIISFKSDRTRSRMGRRIPFILFTAPFLVFFAAAIGFSDDIVKLCKVHITSETGAMTAALVFIGLVVIGFSFFNEFVGTVYYYLVPDVMPRAFLGRFQGVRDVVGYAAGYAINIFIAPYTLDHMRWVHVGVAALYFVGFGLLCLNVKEGKYPPVTDVGEKTTFLEKVQLYFRECFNHPIYILIYLVTATAVLSKGLNPAGIFGLHLNQHQGQALVCPAPAQVSSASADGTRTVTGDRNGHIELLDTTDPRSPKVLRIFQGSGAHPALRVTLSANGQRAAVFFNDGSMSAWDTQSGDTVQDAQRGPVDVVCASTGNCRQTVTADREGTIKLWDTSNLKKPVLLKTVGKTGVAAMSIALSADGDLMAVASDDGSIQVWRISTASQLWKAAAHSGGAFSVAISPDATRLATGGADAQVKIWDMKEGHLIHALGGHDDAVNSVAFSTDGKRLVSGGSDRRIIVWDAVAGTAVATLGRAAGPSTNPSPKAGPADNPGPVYAVCFAPAIDALPAKPLPKMGALRASWHGTVTFLRQIFLDDSMYDPPPDEQSRAVAPDAWVISGGRDGTRDNQNSRVRIWDLASGKIAVVDTLPMVLKGHKAAVTSIAFKPDLRVILSGGADGSIRLWRPWAISKSADDQSFKVFTGYTHRVTTVLAQDSGVGMVNASTDGTLQTWDVDQGVSLWKGGRRGVLFSTLGLLLAYPLGALVDRWNPIKITLVAGLMVAPIPILFYFFYYHYSFAMWVEVFRMPLGMISTFAALPMMVMLYPKAKYGQFCSANALLKQFIGAMAGLGGAAFMDYLTSKSLLTDNYRYGYIFQFIAHMMSMCALIGVYIYWKRLGGKNYVAPGDEREPEPELEIVSPAAPVPS